MKVFHHRMIPDWDSERFEDRAGIYTRMQYGPDETQDASDREALSLEAIIKSALDDSGRRGRVRFGIVGRACRCSPLTNVAGCMALLGYCGACKPSDTRGGSTPEICLCFYLKSSGFFMSDQRLAPIESCICRGRSERSADRGQATLPFWLPPLAEQHRIVAKVDALMALCDRLEAALTTADTTRARLLEALLHEALAPSH